ncbi:MAG: hypothetical protein C5B58_12065 [Acidobacteria bacterium]|nr:MAG: hypothetical protein C5B58_12065 [Acidobacteriota bacterium]
MANHPLVGSSQGFNLLHAFSWMKQTVGSPRGITTSTGVLFEGGLLKAGGNVNVEQKGITRNQRQ